MKRLLYAALAIAFFATQAPAALPPAQTLENATGVLDDLAAIPLKGIPPKLLADAQGVAIFPRVIKVGFAVGVRGGHGVVLARDKDGNWGEPVFASFGGASFGFQAGVESTDVVLVFRSRKSLDRVLEGKVKVTLGADAAVAAGPVGREAMAATDVRLEAEILSYSRTRGLFAGVSLDGSTIHPDPDSNATFQKQVGQEEKKAAEALKAKLVRMSSTNDGPDTPLVRPMPPPVLQPPTPPARPRFRPLRARSFRNR
jgi:lipid-binding SYLF domain-containing protein